MAGIGIVFVGFCLIAAGAGGGNDNLWNFGIAVIVIGAITYIIGDRNEQVAARATSEAAGKAEAEAQRLREIAVARKLERERIEAERAAENSEPELRLLPQMTGFESGVPQRPEGIRWWRKKLEVGERDGWQCRCCGRAVRVYPDGAPPAPDRFEADHIVPFVQGGSNKKSNLQTLCHDCNVRKGSQTIRY
jgi:hypothetical protein